jgi:hypothetical protein
MSGERLLPHRESKGPESGGKRPPLALRYSRHPAEVIF